MKFQVIASWGRMKVAKMSKLIMNLQITEVLLTRRFACFSMSIRASTVRNSIWRNTHQSPLCNWGMRFVWISECFELSFSFLRCVKPSRTCYTSFVHKGKKKSRLISLSHHLTELTTFLFVFLGFSEDIQYTTWSYVFLSVSWFFVIEGNNYWVDFFS